MILVIVGVGLQITILSYIGLQIFKYFFADSVVEKSIAKLFPNFRILLHNISCGIIES